jgi:hypothetical protein
MDNGPLLIPCARCTAKLPPEEQEGRWVCFSCEWKAGLERQAVAAATSADAKPEVSSR